MKQYDWEPAYGTAQHNKHSNVALAEALELVRRRICVYNMGFVDGDVICDCKYGISSETKFHSEQTGCPELREMIQRLLHRPESFSE